MIWTQQFTSPTVYLDTFAIRAIADSDELSARFAQGIKRRDGTWLLASLSMGEFARFADARHVARAELLLGLVVPHIYLFQAEARPQDPTALRSIPPPDRRNMDYFSRRYCQAESMQETFRGMFQLVHENREEMNKTLEEVASSVLSSLQTHRMLATYRQKAKAARIMNGRSRQQIISGELLREPVLNIKAAITPNEVLDLMHAVDAVDYCDFVLLDKAWERRVKALERRITETGIDMPIARCFSGRNNGIVAFLDALENWPCASVSG